MRHNFADRAARLAALSLVAVMAFSAPAHAGDFSPACAVPDPLLSFEGRLESTLARAQAARRITILAIGSSSTEGIGASTRDASYPARLARELKRRLPQVDVTVLNKGIGGETVPETATRLRAEVEAGNPDLVIWQLGTNDALRQVGLERFETIVREGLDWLAARKVDVMLMDPQLFPKVAKNEAYHAFVDRISVMAGHAGVPLLRRFEAMRHWESLPEDVRKPMLAADNFHMNDQGYACLAEVLAEGLSRRLENAGVQAASAR